MPLRSGPGRCRTLIYLSLVFLLPWTSAEGQEIPPGGPPTSEQQAPPGPPVLPLPTLPEFPPIPPPGGEPIGPIGPIRALRFAPLLEGAGPLQVRTSLTVEEEFTDNADQQKNNRRSEFRTRVAPGLAVHLEGARSSVDLAYSPRFFLPDDRPADTTLEHDLTLRGGWSPSPQIRLSLAEDFTRSTDFQAVGDIGTRRTGQSPFTRNGVTAEAAFTPPGGRVAFSYTNGLIRNENPGGDDSATHILRTGADFANPRLSLGGSYSLTRQDFEISSPYWEHTGEGRLRRVLTPTASATLSGLFTYHNSERGSDFIIGRARLGGVMSLGPGGSLEANAGADVFDPQDEAAKIQPSISVVWSQRFAFFSLSAQYQQGFQERFQEVDNTGVTFTRSFAFLVSSSVFRDLTATLGVRWQENEFQQTTLTGVQAGTRDRTWDVEARLQYLLARSLVLTLGYVATIRTSTDPTVGFLENRVRLGITYQYDIF
jgi:hypothetical protein